MVPVLLSQEVLPSAIFYGTVAPVAAYYIIKRMFIDPYLKQKEEE
jgi:DnaJ family protein C protein 11